VGVRSAQLTGNRGKSTSRGGTQTIIRTLNDDIMFGRRKGRGGSLVCGWGKEKWVKTRLFGSCIKRGEIKGRLHEEDPPMSPEEQEWEKKEILTIKISEHPLSRAEVGG